MEGDPSGCPAWLEAESPYTDVMKPGPGRAHLGSAESSRHGLNLAAPLQATHCFLGATVSWDMSQLWSGIHSPPHEAPKTKEQRQ